MHKESVGQEDEDEDEQILRQPSDKLGLEIEKKRRQTTSRSEKTQALFKFVYFSVRYLFVVMTIFLSLIAAIYALSALITTEATNFFCKYLDASEVYQHNRENEYNEGDPGGCWYIEKPKIDINKMKHLDLGIYESSINDQSFVTIFACVIFSLLSLFLLFIGLQNGYYVIYDTIFNYILWNVPNPRVIAVINDYECISKGKKTISSKMAEIEKKCFLERVFIWIEFLYDQYCYIYEKYLYFDSKWKVINSIFWEIMEIIVQFYALCLYGGLNLFHMDTVVLGQHVDIFESFAIIVGLNCVLAGVSWIVYIGWHDTW